MKEVKTNAMRLLEQKKISYEVIEYEFDEDHLDAIHASNSAGLNPEMVYKTIVMKGSSNNLYVFVTPAEFTISLKKARALTGEKEIELLKLDQLLKYTGYIRGGCSPIGMKKSFDTIVDESILKYDSIIFSGGKIGLQIEMKPKDLERVIKVRFLNIIREG